MTVGELKEKIREIPDETEVYVLESEDHGYSGNYCSWIDLDEDSFDYCPTFTYNGKTHTGCLELGKDG